MNNPQTKLAQRLLYLPLDVREKVLLWLTYKGLKPVSEITAERRGNIMALAKRGIRKESQYNFNSSKSKRIRKWIRDAGLYLEVSRDNDTEWHIGKNKDHASESAKIIRKFDPENEVKSGLLFGYPEASTRAYTSNKGKDFDEIKKIMVGTGGLQYEDPFLKDKYYAPYIFYNMPKNRVKEESQIAKTWADTIRKDVPKLAAWFEETK